MNKNNPKIEGPFAFGGGRYPEYLNKCGSCGKIIGKEVSGDREYRRTWNEELFNKTGGREGRTYYCVPCGEELSAKESAEAIEERKKFLEEKIEEVRKTINNCLSIISPYGQRLLTENNVILNGEDYKKVKKVLEEVKKIRAVIDPYTNKEDSYIKWQIEELKKSCWNLIENHVSPKNRKETVDKKRPIIHHICCLVKNIKFDEENDQFYCDYCWEVGDYWSDESSRFLTSLKTYHIDKLNKIMLDNGVSTTELNTSNYHSLLTAPDMILTQKGIRDTYQKAEKDLWDFLKQKGINVDNQIKSNQIKSNQIKSNQIKSNLNYFNSNSITSIELTEQGDLNLKYDKGGSKTVKNEDISPDLQKLIENMKKNGTKKLTKQELEAQLKKLEQERQKLEKGEEQTPAKKPWGLIIGGSLVGVVGLVGLVIVVKVRKNKKNIKN